jgi:hypothetical protein
VNGIKRLGVAGALVALVVCTVAGLRIFAQLWTRAAFAYSGLRYEPGDPRNIHYILWKHGLNRNMNLDIAMAAFYLDTDRDRLIRGATEDQLKNRFGYVRQLEQVSPYLSGVSWPEFETKGTIRGVSSRHSIYGGNGSPEGLGAHSLQGLLKTADSIRTGAPNPQALTIH